MNPIKLLKSLYSNPQPPGGAPPAREVAKGAGQQAVAQQPETQPGEEKGWCGPTLAPLTHQQCSGSMTFWCGSGSADPCCSLMDPDSDPDADADPDPSIFIIDLQDANKKRIFIKKSFSA